jgi:hypothetical protein
MFTGVFDSGGHTAKKSHSRASSTVALGPQKPRGNCQDGFYVQAAAHAGNKVSSALTTGDPKTWPAQAMEIAKHDPAVLQLYWNKTPNGMKFPITDAHQLVGAPGSPDYGCYTALGRDIWNQALGAYENATIVASQAPSFGVNTGVNASTDTPFQEPAGTITGNLTAAKITFQNGTMVWEMQRCKNIVSTSPIPGIPTQGSVPSGTVPTGTVPTTTPHTCAQQSVGKDLVTGTYPNCVKQCINQTACGPNGINAPPVAAGDPGHTPGYVPGSAETAAGAQTPPIDPYKPNPVYGSNPPPGQNAPPGADGGNPTGGGTAGVSNPSGTPNPGGGAAQAPTTTVVTTPTGTTIVSTGGNPCADPNTPGCPGA